MSKEVLKPREESPYASWFDVAAVASGAVAHFADRSEHSEDRLVSAVLKAASDLRYLALDMAEYENLELVNLCTNHIRQEEADSGILGPDFGANAQASETWRDLQLVQINHDRVYLAKVFGDTKYEQSRYQARHLAILSGGLAKIAIRGSVDDDFNKRLIPGFLLFSLRLSTTHGEKLDESPIVSPLKLFK